MDSCKNDCSVVVKVSDLYFEDQGSDPGLKITEKFRR